MKSYSFRLQETQRIWLEERRKELGLASTSEFMRFLIHQERERTFNYESVLNLPAKERPNESK